MSGLAILIPIALGMGLFGLAFFFWAMRNGQFEDLDGAAHRVLMDDDVPAAGDNIGQKKSAQEKPIPSQSPQDEG